MLASHNSTAYDEGKATEFLSKSNAGGFHLKEQIHGIDTSINVPTKQIDSTPPKKLEYFEPIQAESAEQRKNEKFDPRSTISGSVISGGISHIEVAYE